MASGYIRNKHTTDDEMHEELDTSFHPPQAEETQKMLTEEKERLLNKTLQTYETLRRSINQEQRLSQFSRYCSYVDGKCSTCGQLQPWATPWKLRGGWIEGLCILLSFVVAAVALFAVYGMSASSSTLLFIILTFAALILMCALAGVLCNIVEQKIYIPQYEARDEAISREMRRSPYYKRSYPYIAREDDRPDPEDERSRRMAAEFARAKDPSLKRIFVCESCSRIAYAGYQREGKPCRCPKCGMVMAAKEAAAADMHNHSLVHAPADGYVTYWVCVECGSFNREPVYTCQACGVTKAWSETHGRKIT